jgi:hypothetical protein
MRTTVRTRLQASIALSFATPAAVSARLGATEVPTDIAGWLGRLHALIGVPFPYLVPDEGMLPPESIRFFRLDTAWVEALVDGAFSIGRSLAPAADTAATVPAALNPSLVLDQVLHPQVTANSRIAAPLRRRRAATMQAGPLAVADGPPAPQPWYGFVLRSSVVSDYPGLGVNIYPKGHTPSDPDATIILLPVRRLDLLGEKSDTLICLVEGEPYHIDIHEAPEVLHYGIDTYVAGATPTATKVLRTFTVSGGKITWTGDTATVQIGDTFRSAQPRVVKMAALAAKVAAANGIKSVNSAEMGFEMTEGVGKVTFVNRSAT